jgi:hypothetical protein
VKCDVRHGWVANNPADERNNHRQIVIITDTQHNGTERALINDTAQSSGNSPQCTNATQVYIH